jgi:hypothetical protein
LYVKKILSQPVMSEWDLIPIARTGSENNLKRFVEAMSISVIRQVWLVFRGNLSRPHQSALIQFGVVSVCKRSDRIQCPDRCEHYASKSCNFTRKLRLLSTGRRVSRLQIGDRLAMCCAFRPVFIGCANHPAYRFIFVVSKADFDKDK